MEVRCAGVANASGFQEVMREGRNLLRPLPVGGGRDESRPSRSKASYRQEFAKA